ncbi:hypothetical protein MJ560_19555 [Klebsiella pneumoniae]|nr:hypothetical protein MJ560_19555 [Klebsiella pneumoniae]
MPPGETPRIEGFTSRDGNAPEFASTPNENHDFTAGYGFDRQDRDSDSLDRNRLERENYSLSHNGCWDIGNTRAQVLRRKRWITKIQVAERDYYLGKQCHRRQVCPAAGHD